MATIVEEEIDVAEDVETKDKTRHCPLYAVIVWNDDDHTFEYVINTFMKVLGYKPEKCFKLATEIHTKGKALVWSGSLEVAELKKEQIEGAGRDFWAAKKVDWPLKVTLEPID
jgi:ATP-dependent Clp protease adaptor protein ClpS